MDIKTKRFYVSNGLVVLAIGLLIAMYFAPIWWVSLTAPNYPPEAFPDGVRIHFHMNGVFNGCKKVEKEEITEVEALDCVHEMDTINHYVGMYPIASGGVLEKAFSQFLIAMLVVMLLGFITKRPTTRMMVLGLGFGVIATWMYMTWYLDDGLKLQNSGYLEGLVTSLDQDDSAEAEDLAPGAALIARLKESLTSSGVKVEKSTQETKEAAKGKQRSIEHLRVNFEKDMGRKLAVEQQQWNGSGIQMMAWHYGKNLGRYFNEPEKIKPMVEGMTLASHIFFGAILGAMLFLIFATRRNGSLFFWLLILPAILLPVFFIIDYSAWLWWYGHNMNEMGAFSVKAFMPTVFGDGKVAQFSTHSYPYIGFGLMVLASVLLIIAANQRYKLLTYDE